MYEYRFEGGILQEVFTLYEYRFEGGILQEVFTLYEYRFEGGIRHHRTCSNMPSRIKKKTSSLFQHASIVYSMQLPFNELLKF